MVFKEKVYEVEFTEECMKEIDDKNKKVFISHMYYGKRNYLK